MRTFLSSVETGLSHLITCSNLVMKKNHFKVDISFDSMFIKLNWVLELKPSYLWSDSALPVSQLLPPKILPVFNGSI